MRPEEYIAKGLSVYFNGNSLPSDLSKYVRALYKKGLPALEKGKPLHTSEGLEVANNFSKILVTDYGAFVEFETAHINLENIIAAKQHDGKEAIHKLYVDRGGDTKFYYQRISVLGGFTKGNIYVSVYDIFQPNMNKNKAHKNHEAVKFKSPNEIKSLMNK